MEHHWQIAGADGELILGATNEAHSAANVHVILAHGFKGYMDYGLFPRLANELSRRAGVHVHRFHFSHSGMTRDVERFARPDLFERDTWSRQVFDLHRVIEAIGNGRLLSRPVTRRADEHARASIFIVGHSRGGAVAILACGRLTEPGALPDHPKIAGIVTIGTPASTNPLTADQQEQLLRDGSIDSPSARTGQLLRVGKAFLQEQIDQPEAHDLLAHAARCACPALIIHGEDDQTVSALEARRIASAMPSGARMLIIPQGDHVLNTANPHPADQLGGKQLEQAIDAIVKFVVDESRPAINE